MPLVLRLYANCIDEAEADALAMQLERALAPWSPVAVRPPARYWKLTGTFDFAYRLTPATHIGFSDFITRSARGWERHEAPGEAWAVWSPNSGGVLLVQEVRWAELQRFDDTELPWHTQATSEA